MSEPRTWASVHKEWLGDGSLMNGYTKRGLSYATGEMAWNASRAALLADEPDVGELVAKIDGYLSLDDEWPFDDVGDWLALKSTLLSQAARIKALEEENAKLKGHAEEMAAACEVQHRTRLNDAVAAYRRDHPKEGT